VICSFPFAEIERIGGSAEKKKVVVGCGHKQPANIYIDGLIG
jgi:hypothetical protein